MPKRRRRRRSKPRAEPAAKVVHDASLIERLFERGNLSPRQYAIAASVRDAARSMGVIYARAVTTDSSRMFGGRATGQVRTARQESHAQASEILTRALTLAGLHPQGQAVLTAVCVEDTPCRTLDRRFGWRNGTAADVLGRILQAVWEATPKASTMGTHANRMKEPKASA